MTHQLSLSGFEESGRPTDSLFFAVYPDAAAAAQIAAIGAGLRAAHRLHGRLFEPERLHVTLFHLGSHAGLPTDVVEAAKSAASEVRAAPFDVMFDAAESFRGRPRNRPFVLRGGESLVGLMQFQQRLGDALRRHGLTRWTTEQYLPHVTMLYDDRLVALQAVEPVRWTVREFVLMHSLLGQHRHVPLARWPLDLPHTSD